MFDAQEYRTFRRCADFLWSVRCNLHFFTGRAEERLSFDLQREIAVRLGYTSHPGMQDVERFMKHYFLVAKDVGDLTAILCAKLEDQQAKPAPVLSRDDGAAAAGHARGGGCPTATISSSTTTASISPRPMSSSTIRST